MQELRAKIRVLEAKRSDDATQREALEARIREAEVFITLRPKLQAKLSSQQTELGAARRELADAQQLAQLTEARVLDSQEQLEMAMLDKEVAEERAEIAEAELEEVKEKLAILEVEMEVMKEDGGEFIFANFEKPQVDNEGRGWWSKRGQCFDWQRLTGICSTRET